MKKLSLILIALVAGLSFSCGLLDKADVNFDMTLQQDFIVAESGTATAVTKSYEGTLDASSNAEFVKYKDKIKDLKINRITYKVSNYSLTTPVTFSSGSFTVDGTTLATQNEINLLSANGGAEAEITSLNASGASALVAKLKSDSKATVKAQGTLSKTPVAFKLTTYYYVTVTASALK